MTILKPLLQPLLPVEKNRIFLGEMCTEMHPVTRSIFIISRVLHLFHI